MISMTIRRCSKLSKYCIVVVLCPLLGINMFLFVVCPCFGEIYCFFICISSPHFSENDCLIQLVIFICAIGDCLSFDSNIYQYIFRCILILNEIQYIVPIGVGVLLCSNDTSISINQPYCQLFAIKPLVFYWL